MQLRVIITALFIFSFSGCGLLKKVEIEKPEVTIKVDGDYISGCVHSFNFVLVSQGLEPEIITIKAKCMDLYLGWLKHKDKKAL